MGFGSAFKSVTKAVSAPFKSVGKAINWTDIRYAVAGGVLGGIPGALSGMQYGAQHQAQKKAEQMERDAAAREAQASYNASLQTAATPEVQQQPALTDEVAAEEKRRRFSLSRTTMGGSLLGRSVFGGRTTIG